ncbi:hypothetical protein THAOC_09374 [Thalassiosira oceanica]|uniref:VOC domain-containing protein n=1 Tax=Thalassiosira oceanica TaxID=159749 RepID=K0SWN5_THAOC|nr:hypothetical protein THAOC_09374 [Thalassiosira oceanica]|eukprot:EJK69374.1 hypothetical protein THAOC_09374 [Thalassiosira oceanica]
MVGRRVVTLVPPLLLSLKAAAALSAPNMMSTRRRQTLGSAELRDTVQRASSKQSLNTRGIVWLEHLNLVVGDMDTARKFYIDLLGLSQDDNKKHVNLGQQQFHLDATGEFPTRVTGSVGLAVPSLSRLRERLPQAKKDLDSSLFDVISSGEDMMTISCPWGNTFHLYDLESENALLENSAGDNKMTKFHSRLGVYGDQRMAVRGQPGIRFVEISCPPDTIRCIENFYEELIGCQATRSETEETVSVLVGPGVHFVYNESSELDDESIAQMQSVHACVYIPEFETTYKRLKEKDLIWTNPRFTHLDSCDNWEEAAACRTFRFKDIIDARTGETVLELEHETRPMTHGQYMKVPRYRPN